MGTPAVEPDTYVVCDNPRAYRWKTRACRCVGCRDASVREESQRSYRRVMGSPDPLVPNTEMLDAIRKLRHHSRPNRYSVAGIARAAGVSKHSLLCHIHGEHTTVKRSTANKIIGLTMLRTQDGDKLPDSPLRDGRVRIQRAQRAIEGLIFQGYSQQWIATRMGMNPNSSVSDWRTGKFKYISKKNEDLLLAIVKEVGLTPGPSDRARNFARKNGFQALATWDDFL